MMQGEAGAILECRTKEGRAFLCYFEDKCILEGDLE